MARNNLTVAVSSRARRILLEGQRAVGSSAKEDVAGELLGQFPVSWFVHDIPIYPYIVT